MLRFYVYFRLAPGLVMLFGPRVVPRVTSGMPDRLTYPLRQHFSALCLRGWWVPVTVVISLLMMSMLYLEHVLAQVCCSFILCRVSQDDFFFIQNCNNFFFILYGTHWGTDGFKYVDDFINKN